MAVILALPWPASNETCSEFSHQQPFACCEIYRIEEAAGTKASISADGVVRLGWGRDDVKVTIDGMTFPPPAGLGSWAAFTGMERGAIVMGDTVVF